MEGKDPTPLLYHNNEAIHIAYDHLTKHIGMDASFMRSHCQKSTTALYYVPYGLQVAGFFIKYYWEKTYRWAKFSSGHGQAPTTAMWTTMAG